MSKEVVVYHTSWSTYGRNFQVKDVPIDFIDTICYAFWNVLADGTIQPHDKWSDIEKRFDSSIGIEPYDTWNDTNTYFGNFNQFRKLKEKGKNFKLDLSLGGWSLSKYFSDAVLPQNQDNFVRNILQTLDTYPIFNGVSLDWEYYTDDGKNYGLEGNIVRKEDSDNMVSFCKKLRQALNSSGKNSYRISSCFSARPELAKSQRVKELSEVLDELHIMTYDFSSGAWGDKTTAPHTCIKKTSYTPFSTEGVVDEYIRLGVPTNKIYIGAAYYSRGFANTEGMGFPASGGSTDKTWEDGVCDYKVLPLQGATEYYDDKSIAAYSYDPSKKIVNTYDNLNTIYEKCKYVWEKNLKGIIIWETSGDHPVNHPRHLTKNMYQWLKNDPRRMQPPPLPSIKEVGNGVSSGGNIVSSPPSNTPINNVPSSSNPVNNSPSTSGSSSSWKDSTAYKIGDLVEYEGKFYKALQAHTSNAGWLPKFTNGILWSETQAPVSSGQVNVPQAPMPSLPVNPSPVLNVPQPPPNLSDFEIPSSIPVFNGGNIVSPPSNNSPVPSTPINPSNNMPLTPPVPPNTPVMTNPIMSNPMQDPVNCNCADKLIEMFQKGYIKINGTLSFQN